MSSATYLLFLTIFCHSLILQVSGQSRIGFDFNNDTEGTLIEKSNVNKANDGAVQTRIFADDVLRAAAGVSIDDCLCQCHRLTFHDRYGKLHGNCRSTDQTGAKWCYVRSDLNSYQGNHGYSTCPDQERSGRFKGRTWSYHACATPYLDSDVCSYLLQDWRQTHNNNNYRNPIKPRIAPAPHVGYFKNEQGEIVSGNKFVKFDSVIQLVKPRKPSPIFIGDNEIDDSKFNSNDAAVLPSSTDATGAERDATESVEEDAVNFG